MPAYGLMQIVPRFSGRDAYQLFNDQDGVPSKEILFRPEKNIEFGCAYLSILLNGYWNGVEDLAVKEYCAIATYSTGSRNVANTFDDSRANTIIAINQLSSKQVYTRLRNNLRFRETRNYLLKVTNRKGKYI